MGGDLRLSPCCLGYFQAVQPPAYTVLLPSKAGWQVASVGTLLSLQRLQMVHCLKLYGTTQLFLSKHIGSYGKSIAGKID